MPFVLTDDEKQRFRDALKTAIAIPFIDDIEDYILESIWTYAKVIDVVDPFLGIRSKRLYDVVDKPKKIGWSVKSLQWSFYDDCEFELVTQRAAIIKKRDSLGFPGLTLESDPQMLGAALLKHWEIKVNEDAEYQGVNDKRIMVLLKSTNRTDYAIYEDKIELYRPDDITWKWTNARHDGLKGIRNTDNMCVYKWYPSQTQFFERFKLPASAYRFSINPIRCQIETVVQALAPTLEDNS